MKIKNSVAVFLVIGILSATLVLSGCSNKPDLHRWSLSTAKYLIAKKYPKNKVEIIKCKSQKVFGSNVADCKYYLINKANDKFKYFSEFVQSVNDNWYIDYTKYIGNEKFIFKNHIFYKAIKIPSK